MPDALIHSMYALRWIPQHTKPRMPAELLQYMCGRYWYPHHTRLRTPVELVRCTRATDLSTGPTLPEAIAKIMSRGSSIPVTR